MNTRIKICGIKREDEVKIINLFQVSYAGFIFAKSKRQVTVQECNDLSLQLRNDIKKVGVFVNEKLETVLQIIKLCNLDIVQLHGNESVDYIEKIPVQVWKTIPVKDKSSLNRIKSYNKYVSGILYETYNKKLKGGTGMTFDWTLLDSISRTKDCKMILAGGINPSNAKQAIDIVAPDILDVNSGLEVDGYKTIGKVEELFKELKK